MIKPRSIRRAGHLARTGRREIYIQDFGGKVTRKERIKKT
jgi:hypothetical protein